MIEFTYQLGMAGSSAISRCVTRWHHDNHYSTEWMIEFDWIWFDLIWWFTRRTFSSSRADGAGASRGHVLPRGEGRTPTDASGAVVSAATGRALPHRRQQPGENKQRRADWDRPLESNVFDIESQVRKTAQAALLVLLEQELVARDDVEDQVCPLLLMLTNADAHDDFRTEAAAVNARLYHILNPLLALVHFFFLFLFYFCVCCCCLFTLWRRCGEGARRERHG